MGLKIKDKITGTITNADKADKADSVPWSGVENKPTKVALTDGASGSAAIISPITYIPVTEVKQSYVSWDGNCVAENVTPIGAALSNEHSANRLAFIGGDCIDVEYSSDGGKTWTDYGLSANQKTAFCTTEQDISVGRPTSQTEYTTDSRTRITINAVLNGKPYVYTASKKLLINICTSSPVEVLIEHKTDVDEAEWTTYNTYTLRGWSGWNDIPLILNTFGGSYSQISNIRHLRLTFKPISINTGSPKTCSVLGIRLFGSSDWIGASRVMNKGNMSSTGHLYSFDMNACAYFPAEVTATIFNGKLNGNASKDSMGQQISTTYVKSIASDGKNIKYTKGDGTVYTFAPSDTKVLTQSTEPTTQSTGDIWLKSTDLK